MTIVELQTVPLLPLNPKGMRDWLRHRLNHPERFVEGGYLGPASRPYRVNQSHLTWWTLILSLACTGKAAQLPPGEGVIADLYNLVGVDDWMLSPLRETMWESLQKLVAAEVLGQPIPKFAASDDITSDYNFHGWWAMVRAELYVNPAAREFYPNYEENAEYLNRLTLLRGPISKPTPWAILLGHLDGLPYPSSSPVIHDGGYDEAYQWNLREWDRTRESTP